MQNSCNVQHEHFYWLVTNMPQLSTSSWKKNVFLKLSVKICFIMVNGNWAETKVKESLSPPKIKCPNVCEKAWSMVWIRWNECFMFYLAKSRKRVV